MPRPSASICPHILGHPRVSVLIDSHPTNWLRSTLPPGDSHPSNLATLNASSAHNFPPSYLASTLPPSSIGDAVQLMILNNCIIRILLGHRCLRHSRPYSILSQKICNQCADTLMRGWGSGMDAWGGGMIRIQQSIGVVIDRRGHYCILQRSGGRIFNN